MDIRDQYEVIVRKVVNDEYEEEEAVYAYSVVFAEEGGLKIESSRGTQFYDASGWRSVEVRRLM